MQSIPRRRKRKTTERVADLEKKIETLTSLLANESPTNDTTPKSNQDAPNPESTTVDTLIDQAMNRGLIDWPSVCLAFDRYKREMCRYFPFVVFPANMDASTLKEQQPLVFFAIINAATASMHTSPDPELGDMLVKDLSLRIMYRGERSLELVQTLLIQAMFYARGKEMRELNFNQVVHTASTMALDIGLGRRSHKSWTAIFPGKPQLESLAGRRAWLGCYYEATR
jgi:hypothetical protein